MQPSEPTVLDYVKSLLPWSRRQVQIPAPEPEPAVVPAVQEAPREAAVPAAVQEMPVEQEAAASVSVAVPWRSLAALGCALVGQIMFEPPRGVVSLGIALYVVALALLLWAALRNEWTLAPLAE